MNGITQYNCWEELSKSTSRWFIFLVGSFSLKMDDIIKIVEVKVTGIQQTVCNSQLQA